jgi:hypothetical protein
MFEPVAGKDGTVQIEWRGECDHTAEDRLAPPTTGAGRLAEAMTFLTDLLSGGPLPQRDIKVKAVVGGDGVPDGRAGQGDPRGDLRTAGLGAGKCLLLEAL